MRPAGCENCGKVLHYGPITRRLLGEEMRFCSGRCAALFDRIFPDPFSRATLEMAGVLDPAEVSQMKREKEVKAVSAAT